MGGGFLSHEDGQAGGLLVGTGCVDFVAWHSSGTVFNVLG